MKKPTPAELAYADSVGRHFSRQYGISPMTGRVAGWLFICEPPEQTAAEIAEALQASRSAVGTAVALLEQWRLVTRRRAAGERADRIAIVSDMASKALEESEEYVAMSALAREGLELLEGESLERRARLLEIAAFYDFWLARFPLLTAEWRAHRDELIRAGRLPPG